MIKFRYMFWLTVGLVLGWWLASESRGQTTSPYMAIAEIDYGSWTGSGTLIAKDPAGRGLLLSCRHVNPKTGAEAVADWIWAKHKSRIKTVSVVKGQGFDTDLALVVSDTVPAGVSSVAVATLDEAGLPVVAAGYRQGKMRITRPTYYAEMRPDGLIGIDRAFVPGMSGGPLFNRYGEAVGVVVASDMKLYGLSADGPRLKRLVDAWTVAGVLDLRPLK